MEGVTLKRDIGKGNDSNGKGKKCKLERKSKERRDG